MKTEFHQQFGTSWLFIFSRNCRVRRIVGYGFDSQRIRSTHPFLDTLAHRLLNLREHAEYMPEDGWNELKLYGDSGRIE